MVLVVSTAFIRSEEIKFVEAHTFGGLKLQIEITIVRMGLEEDYIAGETLR